jgi:hypothetical protein
VSSTLLGLLVLVLAQDERCLLRDTAVLAPPALLGPSRDARPVDLCPPDRVRASELRDPAMPPTFAPRSDPGGFVCENDGCWAWAGVGQQATLIGAAATLQVWNPTVGPGEHSLAEVALRGGADLGDVLEIGWTVSPRHRADGGPILLVQRWIGGRLQQGSGGLHPWSSAYAPGMDLSGWIGRTIRVGWLRWEGRWWAWFEGSWLGWYDGGDGGPFDVAKVAQWFGEAFFTGSGPTVPMGNGRHPGQTGAARIDKICTVRPGEERCAAPRSLWPQVTDSKAYGLALEGPDAFRYGGAGGTEEIRPRPPPSSASEGTPPATER